MASEDRKAARTAHVTERLLLTPLGVEHLEAMRAMDADPRVMRSINGGRPPEAEGHEQRFRERVESWRAQRPLGVFAIHLREGERSVGDMLGVAMLKRDPRFVEDVEVGWRLAHAHWGNGYATEAARALVDFAFEELRLARLISHSLAWNAASQAVMERLGFHAVITFTYDAELLPGFSIEERRSRLRMLTREEWSAVRAADGERP